MLLLGLSRNFQNIRDIFKIVLGSTSSGVSETSFLRSIDIHNQNGTERLKVNNKT